MTTKARVLHLVVTNCWACPYAEHDSEGGWGPSELHWSCRHPDNRERFIGSTGRDAIIDSCPLPQAK